MKTAILYGSKYGATESCAKQIADKINGQVDLVNILKKRQVDLTGYDAVVLGGAIYAGKMADGVIHTIKGLDLGKVPYGIVLCCMEEGKEEEYLRTNLGDQIVEGAAFMEHLGHGLNFERMNFLVRKMIKKIAKVDKSFTKFDTEAIQRVADAVIQMES
jgi:menaquinone-dependent protoporphyrinogen oxidase